MEDDDNKKKHNIKWGVLEIKDLRVGKIQSGKSYMKTKTALHGLGVDVQLRYKRIKANFFRKEPLKTLEIHGTQSLTIRSGRTRMHYAVV